MLVLRIVPTSEARAFSLPITLQICGWCVDLTFLHRHGRTSPDHINPKLKQSDRDEDNRLMPWRHLYPILAVLVLDAVCV